MSKPELTNVTCSKCTAPLLAFERQKDGRMLLRSFGASVERTDTGPLLAICPRCGHQEPFDCRLLPGV